MISIEMTVSDDQIQSITTYDLLAWLAWPFDLLSIVWDAMIEAHRSVMTGTQIVTTGGYVKEYFIPAGATGSPFRYQDVLTTAFAPLKRVVRYEIREDYLHAVEHRGKSEPSLIAAGSTRQHRNR